MPKHEDRIVFLLDCIVDFYNYLWIQLGFFPDMIVPHSRASLITFEPQCF